MAGALALQAGSPAHAAGVGPIYNSIPSPLPGNLASVGAEAYAFNEFGNQIAFSGTQRTLSTVTVTLSSRARQAGSWNTGDCATTPGSGFSLPMTFNIYVVGSNNAVGSLLATTTQAFTVPYRPSADSTHCTGGRWYDAASATCFNGLATNITFDFSSQNVTLPDKVIYGIAYNTTHYGYQPIGESAACYTSSGGCPYDSFNIALSSDPTDISAGSDPNPGTVYQNSPYGSQYCDGGLAGVNTFRLDSPSSACWGEVAPTTPPYYMPAVQFNVTVGPPTSKDQCKSNGWQQFNNPAFKNQGDCVSYVATHGKNGGNG